MKKKKTITPGLGMNTDDSLRRVLTERGKKYGEFKGHAFISQLLKQVMCGDNFEAYWSGRNKKFHSNWNRLQCDQREALEMIAHKIARILNGDSNYADSWQDIAGYAKLVADRLQREQEITCPQGQSQNL